MNTHVVKIMLNKQLKPITPLECGGEMCKPGHFYGPAIRGHYLLHFVVNGKGKFRTQNGEYLLSDNDIFIIRPYEVTYYEADREQPWTYIWVAFKSDIALPKCIMERDVISVPALKKLFEALVSDEYFSNERVDLAYETYVSGIVIQMLGLLLSDEDTEVGVSDNYVNRAIAIMKSEYCNGVTVTDIAARLHLNRSYFTEHFKEKTGQTPHQYLTDYKMKQAKKLLREKGLPVSVTALSVGYPDVFIFSRAFKNYFGVTPTEYAKSLDN